MVKYMACFLNGWLQGIKEPKQERTESPRRRKFPNLSFFPNVAQTWQVYGEFPDKAKATSFIKFDTVWLCMLNNMTESCLRVNMQDI